MMYQEQLEKKMEPKPISQELKYLMFENKSNNCWLDASMALVAHNKAIKIIADCSPNSMIHEIISAYEKAVSILNYANCNIELRIKTAKEKLLKIQIRTLQYLQPMLKCQTGEPDSAFCALLNLIYDNKLIKENLSITWLWNKKCLVCNTSKLTQGVKPIITLSKVNYFLPDCPTSIYQCSCKTEQEMKLIYKELPPCLFFHFENGAGMGESLPLIFSIQDRKYQLTGVITLEKGEESTVNHFITWIRDPKSNKWLECNDLNTGIISFNLECPEIDLKDVYMYVYESFDKIGKMPIEISTDYMQAHDLESSNVELIDLSNESEDVKPVAMSPSVQSTKKSEEFFENLPVHDPSKQPHSETPKKEKLDTVREKVTSELDTHEVNIIQKSGISEELGTLKETQKESNSSDKKITKKTEHFTSCSNLTKSQPIAKPDLDKQSVSCTNVFAEADCRESLSSKVDEGTKPKIDYSKAIIKNIRYYKDSSPKSTVTSVSSLALLKKMESEKFLKEMTIDTTDTNSKENIQRICSGENQNIPCNENNCKKSTVVSQYQRKEDLQVDSLHVSKMQSLNSDGKKELDNMQFGVFPVKKVLISGEKKDGNSADGVLKPIHKVAEKPIVNKLRDTSSEQNQNKLPIPNASTSVISKCDKIQKHLRVFFKGTNEKETLQNDGCQRQVEDKTYINQSIETSNSSSVKSDESRKRKYSSLQDMSENSYQEHAVTSEVYKKLQRTETDKNECNELSELQVKMQQMAFKRSGKNIKYKIGSTEESPLNVPERKAKKKQSVNIIRVTAVDDRESEVGKIILENQKRLSGKTDKKNRERLHDHKLVKLVDDVVERSFAAFLEQVLRKHNIGP